MLKLVGSILILIASIGLAYSIQIELKEHQKRLFELRSMLTKIFWEMNYSRRPVEMVLLYQVDTQDKCLNEILKEIGYMPSEAMFYPHMKVKEIIIVFTNLLRMQLLITILLMLILFIIQGLLLVISKNL